jgi:hypothetical protein
MKTTKGKFISNVHGKAIIINGLIETNRNKKAPILSNEITPSLNMSPPGINIIITAALQNELIIHAFTHGQKVVFPELFFSKS